MEVIITTLLWYLWYSKVHIFYFSCNTNALHITITNDMDLDLTEVQGFVQIEDFSIKVSTVKLSES